MGFGWQLYIFNETISFSTKQPDSNVINWGTGENNI